MKNLKAKILDVYGLKSPAPMAAFAADLNITPGHLSLLINGGQDWRVATIRRACRLLDIPAEDIGEYFMAAEPEQEEDR